MISAISKPQKLIQHEKEIMIRIAKQLDNKTPSFLSHCSSLGPFLNLGHHGKRLRSTIEERLYLEVEKDSSSSSTLDSYSPSSQVAPEDSLRSFLLMELKVTIVAIFLQLHRDLPNSFWRHGCVEALDEYMFSFIYYKTSTIFVTIVKEFYITLDALDGNSASAWFFNMLVNQDLINDNLDQFKKLFARMLNNRWKRLQELGISILPAQPGVDEKFVLLENLACSNGLEGNLTSDGGQGEAVDHWKPSIEELDEVVKRAQKPLHEKPISKRGNKTRLLKFGIPLLSVLMYLGRYYFRNILQAQK